MDEDSICTEEQNHDHITGIYCHFFSQFTVGDHSDHRCSGALTELNVSN